MFSFHKPKIYRSNLGCCICKAKSSSSRFTDSQKYENEFERCFRIQEKRSGEICNACVLLVKRWKKLSPENRQTKHWHHVVDARAGPGTKLSGNRRIVNHHHNYNHQSAGNSQQPQQQQQQQHQQSSSSKAHQKSNAPSGNSNNRSEVLPLTSSQANNQSTSSGGGGSSSSGRTRTSSFSKARAIDTNVSTFTFGEPPSAYRRNYMTTSGSATYSSHSSLSPLSSNQAGLSKPQSALNSSAFESVIKRFRQRQQQQHLEQQRRQVNRQQRLMARQQQQQQQQQQQEKQQSDRSAVAKQQSTDGCKQGEEAVDEAQSQVKRVKRLSENNGSLASFESLKVASVLDNSIWRREKICCGVIFRGLYNEVAIFPKLIKPCECRSRKQGVVVAGDLADEDATDTDANKLPQTPPTDDLDDTQESTLKRDMIEEDDSPRPRVAKSGSVSSSTSGTGSMEQLLDDAAQRKTSVVRPPTTRQQQPAVTTPVAAKRPRTVPTKRRATKGVDAGRCSPDMSSSKESTSADSPTSGTSSDTSSRMILMIDGEHVIRGEVDDDEDDELVLADALESSNDASSSSAESLVEMEEKNPSALAMG